MTPASRHRPAVRVLAWVTALVWVLSALAFGPTVAASSQEPTQASDPADWDCSAGTLGLGQVHIEYAPVAPGDREADGSPVQRAPRGDGLWVPVIMVHGWTGRSTHPGAGEQTGTFSHQIDLSTAGPHNLVHRSLIGQLQGIPGAAVFTYDYHPYSARWVTDPHIGDGLGALVDCLHQASGQEVIVVAHSMGGLAAQYATAGGPGGPDRSGQVSSVITLGTPFQGSHLAAAVAFGVNRLGLSSPQAAVLRLLLAYCGHASGAHGPEACESVMPPLLSSFDGPGGRALRAGSSELSALPDFPPGVAVHSLAGTQAFRYPGAGYFGIPYDYSPIEIGDVVVMTGSATARGTVVPTRPCPAVLLRTELVGEGFWDARLRFSIPLADAACFHNNLPRATDFTNEVYYLVKDDIAARSSAGVPGDPFTGTWAGDVDQPGFEGYSMRVTIVPDGDTYTAAVDYPELSCGGEWVQDPEALERQDSERETTGDGQMLVLKEQILYGTRCTLVGLVSLSVNDDGTLDWLWLSGSGANAVLHRVEGDALAGGPPAGQGADILAGLEGRNEAPGALMVWLGASAAWPDAPDIEYPSFSACDEARLWCLLGGSVVHTLVDVDALEVRARIPLTSPDPDGALAAAGVDDTARAQILGN